MKRLLLSIVLLGVTGTAWAQASSMTQQTSAPPSRIYASAVVGATFANVTSSMFGGEVGLRIGDSMEVFAEAGRMTDVTSKDTADGAALIGAALGTLGKGTASWTVTSPVNYGAGGIRYLFSRGSLEPYVALTVGVANVEHKSTFALNGTDVTATLSTLGVRLGADLGGRTNSMIFSAGGGVRKPLGALVVDVGVRYGRIFSDPATDTFRVYGGLGFRF
jgi:hypothetical protein